MFVSVLVIVVVAIVAVMAQPRLCGCGTSLCANQCMTVAKDCTTYSLCRKNPLGVTVSGTGSNATVKLYKYPTIDYCIRSLESSFTAPCGVCDPTTKLTVLCPNDPLPPPPADLQLCCCGSSFCSGKCMKVTSCDAFSLLYPSELASTAVTIEGTTNNVTVTFWQYPTVDYCVKYVQKRFSLPCGVCDAETQLSVPCPTGGTTTTNVLTPLPTTQQVVPFTTPLRQDPELCNCGTSLCSGQCFNVREKCDLNGLLCPTNLATAFVGDVVGTDALYNVTFHSSTDLLCSAKPTTTISQPCGVCDPTTQISITCRGTAQLTTATLASGDTTLSHVVVPSGECDGLDKSRVCGCYTTACANSCAPGVAAVNSCSMNCVSGNCDLSTSCACQAATMSTTATTMNDASTPRTDVTNVGARITTVAVLSTSAMAVAVVLLL